MPKLSRPHGSLAGEHPLWTSVLRALCDRLSSERASAIARHAHVLQVTPDALTLGIPADELRQWLRDGRILALDSILASQTDEAVELALIPLSAEPGRDAGLDLSSFIVSPSNQDAVELASAVVRNPGQHANPLLLHGPTGCGKTHLLRAIAHGLAKTQPPGDALQLSAEAFSLELVAAIRSGELVPFHSRLRACTALLIDDVEALAGRHASQAELEHALDALRALQTQVIVTARNAPSEMHELEKPLRTCLQTGVSMRLHPPEWETRVAIVLDRIARWEVEARPDVASEIVSNLGEDLRHLDGLLTGLMTQPLCQEGLTDAALIRRILAQGPGRSARLSPEAVLSVVTRHFNVRLADLRSGTRTPRVIAPRHIAMYMLKRHCGLSFPEVGQRLRRHHTTAIHAFRKIERQRLEKASLHATLDLLEKELFRRTDSGG
jgi:chromosomal replication initiator protein